MTDIRSTTEHTNLDHFYQSVLSKEPNIRLECFSTLENYLSDASTSLECEDLTGFMNGIYKWIQGSNFRV